MVDAITSETDDAPVGPSAEEEAEFLAGEESGNAPIAPAPETKGAVEDESTPLPPMEDLVNRIPAPARELMEELFRARFVTVKRVPKTALKNN